MKSFKLVAFCFAGCFKLAVIPPKAFAKDPPKQEIKFALDWTPNTNHLGIYTAMDQGFFKNEGLSVSIIHPNQTTATKLVAAGSADFGVSFMSDVFKARARGLSVKTLAAVIPHSTSCFAWRTSIDIKTVKDWEGKRYGGWGSTEEEATLRYIMKKFNADFSKLKIVTTGISDFLPSTLKNADFMWIYMGWSGIQAKLAGVKLNTLCAPAIDSVFDRPSPLIVTSEKFLVEHKDLTQRFMRAVKKGYDLASQNPNLAADSLIKQVPELDKNLVKESSLFLAKEFKNGVKKWGLTEDSKWKEVGQWMLDQKIIDKLDPIPNYFTNDFVNHD